MPVSLATARDPFRGGTHPRPPLRTPQARVLAALYPAYPGDPRGEWPTFTRAMLAVRAGYTAISGTVTRALNGIARTDSKMGAAHPGLLALGYVEEYPIDIEGRREVNYRATAAGVAAYQAHLAGGGGEIAPPRPPSSCTNDRYKRVEDSAS